jgi:hypothetical protein
MAEDYDVDDLRGMRADHVLSLVLATDKNAEGQPTSGAGCK